MTMVASVDDYIVTLDEDGNPVQVNLHTGEVTSIPTELEVAEQKLTQTGYRAIQNEFGEWVYVPKNLPQEALKNVLGAKYHHPYSTFTALKIASLVAEGMTLAKVADEPNMPPYATLAKWRRDHQDFAMLLKDAVRDSAQIYIQRALDEIENAGADRDEINLAKLRADMYKFMAKVSAPDEFTEKTKVEADVAVTGYQIETGIRRPGDPGFNKDESLERDVTPPLDKGPGND